MTVLTYVLITRNRKKRLLETIQRLIENTPLPREQWEAIVVDNASEDGTGAALRRHHPWVSLIALSTNEGMPARNRALHAVRGSYVAFLDDDSYPAPGAIENALYYLSTHSEVGALVARCRLPNGSSEAPAFPAVTLGGASIIRRDVLEAVGGFAPEFFRQAEEYDFSFRVWQHGFTIERFEDLQFIHDKDVVGARRSALTQRMDLRNNLILVERYLPRVLRSVYRADWLRRYGALALHEGFAADAGVALHEARQWAQREASEGRRQTLDAATVEKLFDLEGQARQVRAWAGAHGIHRVVIADLSKNLYATWHACQLAGLTIVSIADDNPAFAGRRYRGARVEALAEAARCEIDGIVLSNINPAQIDARFAELRRHFSSQPILRLWEPRYLNRAPVPTPGESVAA